MSDIGRNGSGAWGRIRLARFHEIFRKVNVNWAHSIISNTDMPAAGFRWHSSRNHIGKCLSPQEFVNRRGHTSAGMAEHFNTSRSARVPRRAPFAEWLADKIASAQRTIRITRVNFRPDTGLNSVALNCAPDCMNEDAALPMLFETIDAANHSSALHGSFNNPCSSMVTCPELSPVIKASSSRPGGRQLSALSR